MGDKKNGVILFFLIFVLWGYKTSFFFVLKNITTFIYNISSNKYLFFFVIKIFGNIKTKITFKKLIN